MNEKFKLISVYPLVYIKGHINAVVQYNGKTFRYSVAKVPEDSFLKASKMLKETSSLPDAKDMAAEINATLQLLKDAIYEIVPQLAPDDNLYKKEVDERIAKMRYSNTSANKTNSSIVAVNDSVVENYKAWLDKRVNGKRNGDNRKDCISTYRLLQDFEYDLGYTISYADIDDSFIDSLVEYCYDKRVNTEEHLYKTRGGMANKTINKRLDCLFQFLREMKKLPEGLSKKHRLDVTPKDIVRLDTSEIKQLMELEIDDPNLEKARDSLVFLCLTGLRYGDFEKLDRTYIKDDHIVLNTNKTKKGCRIYLFDIAKKIGEKYDYAFSPPCNFVLNKQIHSLLVNYDLFPEEITTSYQARDRVVVKKPKRDYITCHTGRRSFISMLAEEGFDFTDIMSATGHTSVKMVQVYVDLFGKRRDEKFKKFDKINFCKDEETN